MNLKRTVGMAALAVLFMVTAGCGREAREFISTAPSGSEAAGRTEIQDEDNSYEGTGDADTALDASIYVYVCGEVNSPGVYALREDARAFEAVEAAGGMTADADGQAVNLARILRDGEQLIVPSRLNAPAAGTAGGKVNINTADVPALMTLSGIGESKAEAIIAYREEKGPFTVIEDIMLVGGIKSSLFDRIKDDITVG